MNKSSGDCRTSFSCKHVWEFEPSFMGDHKETFDCSVWFYKQTSTNDFDVRLRPVPHSLTLKAHWDRPDKNHEDEGLGFFCAVICVHKVMHSDCAQDLTQQGRVQTRAMFRGKPCAVIQRSVWVWVSCAGLNYQHEDEMKKGWTSKSSTPVYSFQ